MRPVSKKRQELMKRVKPIRDALREEVGRCEICERSRGTLDIHEIGRGCSREACLGERCALLVVCRGCHSEKLSQASQWPESRQLALLARRRPQDFDLSRFLSITSPRAPRRIEIEEIMDFMKEQYLSKSDIAKRLNVDRRTVHNWVASGQLPAIDCRTAGAGKPLYRVAQSDFLAFCASRRVPGR